MNEREELREKIEEIIWGDRLTTWQEAQEYVTSEQWRVAVEETRATADRILELIEARKVR